MKTPRHPRGDDGYPRPTAGQRGYDARWRKRRDAFLLIHPRCVLCPEPSTVADHFPRSRKQLIRDGVLDPDADGFLRALCHVCHSRETARLQPGGWHTPHARRRREKKKHPGLID
jgi:5-methylcytosine-specific restriction protein A